MNILQDHIQKPDTDFEPNLVNTVCFLVQWVVQLTTFGVNYLGHPFNQSLLENKGLSVALRYGTIGFIVAATNILPGTDWALSLVSFTNIKHTLDVLSKVLLSNARVNTGLPLQACCLNLPWQIVRQRLNTKSASNL